MRKKLMLSEYSITRWQSLVEGDARIENTGWEEEAEEDDARCVECEQGDGDGVGVGEGEETEEKMVLGVEL